MYKRQVQLRATSPSSRPPAAATAQARLPASETVSYTHLTLLSEAGSLACAVAAAGGRDDGDVALSWTATGDTVRTLVARVASRAHGAADTLATRVACP